MEQKMKMLENLQDDFDFNYKTLKSQGGRFSSRFNYLPFFLILPIVTFDLYFFFFFVRVVPGSER